MQNSISGYLAGLVLLAGCASPETVLRSEGPTMKELLEHGSVPGAASSSADRRWYTIRESMVPSLRPYTRTATNEIQQLFPTHPNPTIAIYVYPHLSTRHDAPVPGYTTAIKLYETDQYALPGELAGRR